MSELNINVTTVHVDDMAMSSIPQMHHLMSLMIGKNSEFPKLKTDDQKCTMYFPQILRWMFEQRGKFCFSGERASD